MTQIAVVGAGIAGLNAALTLQDAGLRYSRKSWTHWSWERSSFISLAEPSTIRPVLQSGRLTVEGFTSHVAY